MTLHKLFAPLWIQDQGKHKIKGWICVLYNRFNDCIFCMSFQRFCYPLFQWAVTCFLYKHVENLELFVRYPLSIFDNVGKYYVLHDSNRKVCNNFHPCFKNISCNKKVLNVKNDEKVVLFHEQTIAFNNKSVNRRE